jgi:hypothetical protein
LFLFSVSFLRETLPSALLAMAAAFPLRRPFPSLAFGFAG